MDLESSWPASLDNGAVVAEWAQLLEKENLHVGVGQKTESSLLRTDTIEAEVGLVDEAVPDAAKLGHQVIGHLVGELDCVSAVFQRSQCDLLNVPGYSLVEARLGHHEIENGASLVQADHPVESGLHKRKLRKRSQT